MPINISNATGNKDQTPSVSPDGLTLMFSSDRSPTKGGTDIWVAHRQQRNGSPWDTPIPVDRLNSVNDDSGQNMSADGKTVVFGSMRNSPLLDLFIANRADVTAESWSMPAELTALDIATTNESHPFISADLLTIYFQSNRNGSTDLFTAHRTNPTLPFDPPVPITELNTPMSDGDPWVSPDGHHMFFSSNREGSTSAIWETTR
jgi:Tol biopolymer transport system component